MDNCAMIRKMFSLYFSTKSTTISMFFQVLETKKKKIQKMFWWTKMRAWGFKFCFYYYYYYYKKIIAGLLLFKCLAKKATHPMRYLELMRVGKVFKTMNKTKNVTAVKDVSLGKYSWRCQKAQEIRKACGLSSLQLSNGSLLSITAHLMSRPIS